MACLSTVVAHLVKLFVTLACLKNLNQFERVKYSQWSSRAFRILLVHSLFGMVRFGTDVSTSHSSGAHQLRSFYNWFNCVSESLLMAFANMDILNKYIFDSKLKTFISLAGAIPVLYLLITPPSENQIRKYQVIMNMVVSFQAIPLVIIGIHTGNYNVFSFAASLFIQCFFAKEFSDRYDIPYQDLSQYCLSFVILFTTFTLKEK